MSQTRLLHLYRTPALSSYQRDVLIKAVRDGVIADITDIATEFCFTIEAASPLTDDELQLLRWLLAETFEPEHFSERSFLAEKTDDRCQNADKGAVERLGSGLWALSSVIEVGPRMNFTTAWSSNAVSICRAVGISSVQRIERSRRYRISRKKEGGITEQELTGFLSLVHDRMTECPYPAPLTSFETGITPEPVKTIPFLEEGKEALIRINREMGLGLDDWDIDYYYNLFVNDLKRNPTNVECFDLGQSNSEHSRHWFFRGRLVIDGKEVPETLMQIVKAPYKRNPNNSVIAFNDNSSAIRGFEISTITPEKPGQPSPFREKTLPYHITLTAETHNFPTGVAPFPGAETGTGGRIRDVHATGRGSLVVAGTAAYCVGNLRIPNYPLPWEDVSYSYPSNLATALKIEIAASNGASDYGNKFGEPLIQGFTRSFGLTLPDGERREWIKPIMFTAGVGQMDGRHLEKGEPEKGMVVVKVGGPAYRIGMGGGAASSMISGENVEELDFNAVQRGDAEMEQKVNRVIRACVELVEGNPIISIHDQGAGGNCNVVKEIVHPAGARIDIRKVLVGDSTLSVLEIWGAEYQEQDALLVHSNQLGMFRDLCSREKVPVAVIGEITGEGSMVLFDSNDGSVLEDLDLQKVLGDMPAKTFSMERVAQENTPLAIPKGTTVADALDRVLRNLSVGSKRFLTNKVDRSVTGLIARQQCAGSLQLTVSDVAVIAQSHFPSEGKYTGAAIAIGEQPLKGLINASAMARMSVGEALTNMVWARITGLQDIRCSANWMWAPKLPGEGARLYDAAVAMSAMMIDLGIAVDGGKDSLSMAAKVIHPTGEAEMIKSPGTLVISAYAACPDVTKVVTPDIKKPGKSSILFIDLGQGKDRLGGSALAHCYGQVGDETPDMEEPALLKKTFEAVQLLIDKGLILAGHDRSDGGLVTTLLEMAFSGNCGMEIEISGQPSAVSNQHSAIKALFSEELGLAVEYMPEHEGEVFSVLHNLSVPFQVIGKTLEEKRITILAGETPVLNEEMTKLRAAWEETSYRLELLQANPECVEQERSSSIDRTGPSYQVSFSPEPTADQILHKEQKPAVAVIREEGSNGDREMTSAFHLAGFEVWDVTMTDLIEGRTDLSGFSGVVFVGGFSYADVMDSAKGWAGAIRFHAKLYDQFQEFYNRPDTFSLGVCNGCQLMALLGWVPWQGTADEKQPRFIHNKSGRFESRFSTVKILPSPALMLQGMEGSTLGVWVAHGEGLAHFPDRTIMDEVLAKNLAPIRYVDDSGDFTELYPFNPNGSPQGITALCSPDGRHLAMMPHPERAILPWQWAWMPEEMKGTPVAPWLRMFQNARQWCEEQRER